MGDALPAGGAPPFFAWFGGRGQPGGEGVCAGRGAGNFCGGWTRGSCGGRGPSSNALGGGGVLGGRGHRMGRWVRVCVGKDDPFGKKGGLLSGRRGGGPSARRGTACREKGFYPGPRRDGLRLVTAGG